MSFGPSTCMNFSPDEEINPFGRDGDMLESPDIYVIKIYTYTGILLSAEYIFVKNYLCPSTPFCNCFTESNNFTARYDIASAVVYCSKRCSNFAVSLNQYAHSLKRHRTKYGKSWRCLVNMNLFLHKDIFLQIDYAWGTRLALLSYKWSLLVDATAWLSTLGGGHSALGEHSPLHANKAGNLSVKQFRLALELGDKGLEYRCRLYYSLSLIQRGRLNESKTLVRRIFAVTKASLRDQRLLAMCQGVWSKLRYHYTKRQNTSILFNHSSNGVMRSESGDKQD